MRLRHVWVALFCLCLCTMAVLADQLKLKDGTVLEGKVIPQGDKYWIKLSTGETKIVNKSDVASFVQGDAKSAGGTAGSSKTTPQPPSGQKVPPAPNAAAAVPNSFAAVKAKAEASMSPVQGVQIWENYIATKPAPGDLENAKAELEKWNKLSKDNAEKIKGVWVGGVERKRIVKQAKTMVKEGVKQIEDGQSTVGFKKIEDALNLYPQSFEANFYLGLYYLRKSAINPNAHAFNLEYLDKAVKILENTSKIAPKSSSTWSNLAIGYTFKRKHRESVEAAYKAAMMHESAETVQNLVSAFRYAPGGMEKQPWAKEILENSVLMAERHGIQLRGQDDKGFVYVPPVETDEIPGSAGPAGLVWSGSGFFVTSDGYILTNHHVATGDPKTPIKPEISFRVRLDDGTEKPAELIAVDDAADIALMKIKTDTPVVPFKLASYMPNQGSDAMALGYPATGDDEFTLQVSPGAVKSVHEGDEHEIWLDLNTTHGNSGGPIVDANNNVISIVTAYRQSYNMDIFLGVSTNQIKTFLTKIGDKPPKLEYVEKPSGGPEFSAEKLTQQAKVSTVLVMAVRTE